MQPDAKGTASKDSPIAIANKYGLITVGEAHVHMVKGSGKIVSVYTETSLGTVEVALDGYNGPIRYRFILARASAVTILRCGMRWALSP